jgi:phosphonate transport system ATP-binding protein
MLTLTELTRRFDALAAINAVSLSVPAGQTIGVIGWLGEPVSALRGRELCRWRSTCAMIFQQFNLLPRIDWLSGMVRRHFIGKRTL